MTTIENGRYTAMIDRFEDEQAVLLVEDDDGSLVGEAVVDQAILPESARHRDAVLTIELEAGELRDAVYEEAETDRRTEQVRDRFEQLSQRLSSDEEGDQ